MSVGSGSVPSQDPNVSVEERMSRLDEADEQIAAIAREAGMFIQQFTNPTTNTDTQISQTGTAQDNLKQFCQAVKNVESVISSEMMFLSRVSSHYPHEGAAYDSILNLQLSENQAQHNLQLLQRAAGPEPLVSSTHPLILKHEP